MSQTSPPAVAAAVIVANVASEEDPFVVKLDQNDPTHPKVRIALRFSLVDPERLTIVGGMRLEPFEGQEMVLDDVGWSLGVQHDFCVVCPGGRH